MGTADLAAVLAARKAATSQAQAQADAGDEAAPRPPAKKAASGKRTTKRAAAAPATTPRGSGEAATLRVAPDPQGDQDEDGLAGLRRDEAPRKVQLGQRISEETARRFRRFCAVQDVNQGEFLDLAIRQALERYGAE